MTSGPGGEPGRDRWLLSFADLLTLLFAFMLVLYASTAFNDEQQRELGQSLRTSFGGTPASSVTFKKSWTIGVGSQRP